MRRYWRGYLWGCLCTVLANAIWVQFPRVIGVAIGDMTVRVTVGKIFGYAALVMGVTVAHGILLLLHALDHHRHLARYRVRPAQRPLRATGKAIRLVLPGTSHRRHHGPHDQRPGRRAHAPRPGHHVHREHGALLRRSALFPAAHQPLPDPNRAGAHAPGQHLHPVHGPQNSRALRAHPGHVFRHLRPGAGKFLRRPPRARLCSGRSPGQSFRNAPTGNTSAAPSAWCASWACSGPPSNSCSDWPW